ncbi:MAG: glycosyltransferase [Bacteroidetes bacterium]|nr:glycosyltransferase [Bacteroidota bacterium]
MQRDAPHAVFLSYDGMTDPLGQSQVIPYLAGLVRQGYRISIISFEKPAVFEQQRGTIQALLDRSGIQWIPLSYTKSPPVLSTVYDILRMYRTVLALHHRTPIQLLHARSYISARVALTIGRKTGIPWLFDMRGFYADERVDGHLWPQSNPIFRSVYGYFKRRELDFLRESSAVISLTHAGKRFMETKLLPGLDSNKTRVIPCCADLDRFDYTRFAPADRDAVRKELGIDPNALVVVYSGSVGTWYMLDEMLQWFVELQKRRPDAVFIFLSAEQERISQRAVYFGIHNINLVIRKVVYAEMPRYLNCADLGLFFIVPTFSKQASSPTKMGELMGMGIPLVCNSGVGDVGDIVQQSQCGIALDVNDPEQMQASVTQVESLLPLDKATIRQAAFRFYSLQAGIETYAATYAQVLSPDKRNPDPKT